MKVYIIKNYVATIYSNINKIQDMTQPPEYMPASNLKCEGYWRKGYKPIILGLKNKIGLIEPYL